MIFNMDELSIVFPEHLWLELSEKEREYAWKKTADQPYSNAAARWIAFVNCLCSNAFLTWLKEDPDLQEMPQVWHREADLPSFWDVVNGTGLILGETRLVIIPSEKSNLQEFQIPQEWVDIPNWAANYYLAVQLNLEEHWLRVWGYATHQQVQEEGQYDPLDRNYSLDREDLIQDLNVMWVARELCSPKQPQVKPLPILPPAEAEKLLKQLGQQTAYSPRLTVTFEQWGALLASDSYREYLYQLRLKKLKSETMERTQPLVNNLSQWFHNLFESGWQSLDTLLSTQQKTLAFQFRSDAVLNAVRVKGAKLIDLGMDLKGQAVMLLVGLTPEIDGKVSIRVQLHPADGETYLPANLSLALLSQSGTTLQDVTSRTHDHYIQLRRFKSPPGKSFSIQVALNDVSIREDFMLEPLAS
ncbi:MAG: DUF1822 family protein [Coleofasciculus sp. S288]|nr:DUF1822 family protein [Coleofasciculus sp. S288]